MSEVCVVLCVQLCVYVMNDAQPGRPGVHYRQGPRARGRLAVTGAGDVKKDRLTLTCDNTR